MKKLLKTNKILIIIAISAIILLIYFSINKPLNVSGKVTSSAKSNGISKPVVITKENFAQYFEKQQIVKDLPGKAVISLKFYNYDTGKRQWEESYTVTKSGVRLEETSDADLEITLHSKYLTKLGSFCSAVKSAREGGDMAFELKISKIKFLWRYKGMMKYKGCLGY